MVELERINSTSLSEGAVVIPLQSITEKPNPGFACDAPEERAFFLKEEFATFSGMESYGSNCCEFRIISQIPWMDHYAWAIFGQYNVKLERDEVNRKVHGRAAFVSQQFAFELLDGADYGYFQMICIPENICCDGAYFNKFDLLTFVAYKDRKVSHRVAKPPVITLRPLADQTYIPLIPGQHLQLVLPNETEVEVIEEGNLAVVPGMSKYFSLGKFDVKESMKAFTYCCRTLPETVEPIFVSNRGATLAVLIAPLKREETGLFATILKPVKEAVVYTEGIDGIHMICPNKEKWAWDEKCVQMRETPEGVDIIMMKPTNSLYFHYDSGVWWVYENSNMAVGKL